MRRSKPRIPEILDYRHKGVKRKNNPEEGLANYLPEERMKKSYQYDPHLDPQLVWAGKAEHGTIEVPVVSLHIHERVTPKAVVNSLMGRKEHQARLFDEEVYPLEKRVDFYKHEMDWANRLILGDSLIVLNSLLTKELMGGRVQMIYVDPPYGIAYNSNFQPATDLKDVKDKQDVYLTREPEQIKAYRDTWTLGVHSYLAYLRDRLTLCKELLCDSGSIFVQISQENVHHVRELLDEIFEPDNFCDIIVFVKTSGQTTEILPPVVDYLLWYAKDKSKIKYHQLYQGRLPIEKATDRYVCVETDDGRVIDLSKKQLSGEEPIPEGRFLRLSPVSSQTGGESSRFPVQFQGQTFHPPLRRGWSTTKEGFERLSRANRLYNVGNRLVWKNYHDDFPFRAITNLWTDTLRTGFGEKKVYVVQTLAKVVERCILMTTDPGDLVLDPTCGSGTTAYSAESWGRRWITCDTSRVALAIARERMLVSVYSYYSLARPEEGIKSGLNYRVAKRVTFKSLAQGEPPEIVTLYDDVDIDESAIRVSGPFTVEAIPAPSVVTPGRPEVIPPSAESESYVSALVQAVQKAGIHFPGGRTLKLAGVTPLSSVGFLHAEGMVSNGESRRVAISFGPRYGPLGSRQAEEAIRTATANGYSLLVMAGFSIDPAAQEFVQKTPLRLEVQFAHINPDMEIHDLLKQTQGSQLFTVFGEPDVKVTVNPAGKFVVSLRGVDIYDPSSGTSEQTEGQELPAWFLDGDFDGFSFSISQAFFPNGATSANPWDKLENALHGSVDKERIELLRGTESLPFDAGPHSTIAVKVIDARGNEVIKVVKLKGKE